MPANPVPSAKLYLKNILTDATLQAAAPGGVWAGFAPPKTVYPFVTYNLIDATDSGNIQGKVLLSNTLWSVEVVTKKYDSADSTAAANRIDTLLNPDISAGREVTQSDGSIMQASYRVRPMDRSEITVGETYNHTGGLYRIIIQNS